MAKLTHVQQSQDGPEPLQPEFEQLSVHDMAGDNAIKNDNKYIIFKLVNNKKKGRVWIDGIDDVVNTDTKKIERMRLVTGHPSEWIKDQKDLTDEFVRKNRRSLCFEDRVLRLPSWDETAIRFARQSRHFIENPNRKTGSKHEFFEWNPKRQEEEALKKEMLEIEVMQLAMNQPFDKLRKHAAFLGGITFHDELGEPRTEQGIRTLYIREAKRNPERFKKTLGSKEVEINYLVTRAILDTKIDLGGKSGSISWANGGFICKLPVGRSAKEYLIEFAMLPNEEAKNFVEQLQKQ